MTSQDALREAIDVAHEAYAHAPDDATSLDITAATCRALLRSLEVHGYKVLGRDAGGCESITTLAFQEVWDAAPSILGTEQHDKVRQHIRDRIDSDPDLPVEGCAGRWGLTNSRLDGKL